MLFSPVFVLPDNALAELSGLNSLLDHVLPTGSLQSAREASQRAAKDFEELAAEYERTDGTLLGIRIIRQLLNVLLLRLGQSNRVDDFARWLGCSPKTLHSSCMTMRGFGPKAMIERRLVLEAQRLLAHTARSVEHISAELGFSEPANFTRMFRRVAGTSPGRFRIAHSVLVMRGSIFAACGRCAVEER